MSFIGASSQAQMHQKAFGGRAPPRHGELTPLPQTPRLNLREGQGGGNGEMERRGRERKVRERIKMKSKRVTIPILFCFLHH